MLITVSASSVAWRTHALSPKWGSRTFPSALQGHLSEPPAPLHDLTSAMNAAH